MCEFLSTLFWIWALWSLWNWCRLRWAKRQQKRIARDAQKEEGKKNRELSEYERQRRQELEALGISDEFKRGQINRKIPFDKVLRWEGERRTNAESARTKEGGDS